MAKSIRIGNPYQNYSDDFAGAEDPLSRGGRFLANTNTLLTRFYLSGGRALGKSVGPSSSYDDSAALMSGFGPDVEMTATVYRDTGINQSATHECEFLFRSTSDSLTTDQYEALFSFNGGVQGVRWRKNGTSQEFDFLSSTGGVGSIGRMFATGEKIRARMQGSILTLSHIDLSNVVTVLAIYNNSALTSGDHGIGAFFRVGDGANPAHFCFEDLLITEV